MRKRILLVFMTAAIALTGGCGRSIYSNYHEIEQLKLIQTIGIDSSQEGVTLSVSSGSNFADSESVRISQTGASITSAMDMIQNYSAYEDLFYSHVKYVIFGQNAALDGILGYLDFFDRGVQIHQNVSLFISKDSNAKTLVTQIDNNGSDVTEDLASFERDAQQSGDIYTFTCQEVIYRLASYGAALICAIEPADTAGSIYSAGDRSGGGGTGSGMPGGGGSDGGGSDGGGGQSQKSSGITAISCGYGIIKDGKLCGYIPEEYMRGVSLLINKIRASYIPLVQDDGTTVTISLLKSDTGIKPVWSKQGELERFSIACDISAAISELSRPLRVEDPAVIDELELGFESLFYDWIYNVLIQSQSLNADFLGLGKISERDAPYKYENIRGEWPDIFQEIEFDIEVDVTLDGSYYLGDSVNSFGLGRDGEYE